MCQSMMRAEVPQTAMEMTLMGLGGGTGRWAELFSGGGGGTRSMLSCV